MSTTATPLSEAIAECRRQQQAWAKLSVAQRLRPVRALRSLLVTECDTLVDAVVRDLGKSEEEAIGGDVLPLAEACRFLDREAARLLRPRRVSLLSTPVWLWPQSDTVHRRPHGLVGVIGTWNYPIFLSGVALVQGLTAGNGIVWKPSEVAPASADALFALVEKAGFPPGLVHKMEATREGGRQLAEADIDHVSFVGSSTTGALLAETLGRRLISSTLELSGIDSFFVLDDADPQYSARAAWWAITVNRGQTCIAARRVFVARPRYQAFVEALEPLVKAAAPMRLALPSQVQQADRLVREAAAGGARLLSGNGSGMGDDGSAYPPTVVLDAKPEMGLCREATFAPVAAVIPFDAVDEAVRMDHECRYGLGASVFTEDLERGSRLAAELKAGMVAVNDTVLTTASPATPFGGRGSSGWGVTQGAEGLLGMTVPQVVSVRTGRFRPHYDLATQPPGGQTDLLRGFLAAGHAPTLGQRLAGWRRLMGAMWKRLRRKS
jgi:acyl-CoA reductase-like NAD-dependent aldehyde dehydrogenase